MKKLLFLSLFISCRLIVLPQENKLDGRDTIRTAEIEILADRGYSFEQIIGDSSLIFQKNLTLEDYEENSIYWIKSVLNNTSGRYSEYYLGAFPNMDNTYFYFDTNQQKWETRKGGTAALNAMGRKGLVKLGLYPHEPIGLYVKINVEKFAGSPYQTTASLSLAKAEHVEKQAHQAYMYWIIGMVVVGIFFIFNGYVYLMFRDRAYLYYLGTLASGLLYLTARTEQIHRLVPIRFFQVKVCNDNWVCFYDFNLLIINLSIGFTLCFLILFTREFLQTKTILPSYDKLLKYVNYIFVPYMMISGLVTYSGILFMKERRYITIENIIIFFIILLVATTGIMAYRKKFKPAKYFLLANSVQLFIIASLALYFTINKGQENSSPGLLATIGIIIQALAFAISLVARINVLKEELRKEKEESIRLQNHNEQISLRNKLVELEKQKLQEEFDFKNRQLASTTMLLFNKNEVLNKLQAHIKKFTQPGNPENVIIQIKDTLSNNNYMDADWEKFKLHFEQVHPEFFKNLEFNYPDLTPYETRLCAYLHMQLSGKEIATLLNIDPASVRKAKMRLKKKMNADFV